MAATKQTRQQKAAAVHGIIWAASRQDGSRWAYCPKSDGTGYYKITEAGCTCRGFEFRGTCRHADAVSNAIVARKGWPAGETREVCESCGEPMDRTGRLCQRCKAQADADMQRIYGAA